MAKNGNGSTTENVSITIKTSILFFLDQYCERKELTKSQGAQTAIKRFLASEMADDPMFWQELYSKADEEGKLDKL